MARPAVLQDGPHRHQGCGLLQVFALVLGAAHAGGCHGQRPGGVSVRPHRSASLVTVPCITLPALRQTSMVSVTCKRVNSCMTVSDCSHAQLAGYKVKCMLAEPKSKRGRADSGGGSLDNTSWQVCSPAHACSPH